MLLALTTEQVPLILFGFLLVGLGLSVIAPTTYSLVGDAAGKQAGAASSVLTTIGYSGYLVGPMLVGGVAEFAGLRLALASVVIAGLGIVLLSSLAWVRAATALFNYRAYASRRQI
jgi:MFS family permease